LGIRKGEEVCAQLGLEMDMTTILPEDRCSLQNADVISTTDNG
jgi:hypothetical protein